MRGNSERGPVASIASRAGAGRIDNRNLQVKLLALALAATLVWPAAAWASGLLAAGSGIPDQGMAYATVGKPLTPSSAAFANPAGLVEFHGNYMSGGIGVIRIENWIHSAPYSSFDQSNTSFALSPAYAAAFEGSGGWHYGLALYGSVGLGYYFDKDPESGWNGGFVSETSVSGLAFAAAYEISDRLAVGAAIAPQFGNIRTHYVIPGQGDNPDFLVKYKLNGPGIQANAGVRWEPYDGVYLGLGLRSPGVVWASGSSVLPGLGRRGMNLDMQLPMQVTAGANTEVGERLLLGISGRWTDSSSFQNSYFKFNDAPAAFDRRMIEVSSDEWRYAVGLSYAATKRLTLLLGFDYSNTIVGDRAMTPLLYDSATKTITGGVSVSLGTWIADVSLVHTFGSDREVTPDEAMMLPGSYGGRGSALLLGLRTPFGS